MGVGLGGGFWRRAAPVRPLGEFSANVGADDLDFVKEIRGMSEARKAVERFRSPELMALPPGGSRHFHLVSGQRVQQVPHHLSRAAIFKVCRRFALLAFAFSLGF